MTVDRRRCRRRKSYLSGRIVFNGGWTTGDCLIRDISAEGARLVLPQSAFVPDRFDLLLTARGRAYHARRVWRDTTDVGVSLEGEVLSPLSDAAARNRRLSSDNRQLRRRIEDLLS